MTPAASAFESPLCLPLNTALVAALARMTQAIGSADWFDAVLNLLGTVCAVDSGGAMVYQLATRRTAEISACTSMKRSRRSTGGRSAAG